MEKPQLTSFSLLRNLPYQQRERYLPNAFDESLTILEKLNKAIKFLNQIGEITNEVMEQWNQVMEWIVGNGLEDTVREILLGWYETGMFNDIVEGLIADGIIEKMLESQNLIDILKDLIDQLIPEKDFINVRDFGVIGDGNTIVDDSIKIQEAINAATSKKINVIYFPAGTYILKTLISLPSDIVLYSPSGVKFKRYHNDNVLLNFYKNDQILSGYNASSNITIDGGEWDFRGGFQGAGQMFVFAHGKNLTVKNVTILDVNGGHGIEFNSSDGLLVENCLFKGYKGEDFRGAIQLDIDTADTLGGDLVGYQSKDATQSKNIRIKNCRFESSSLGSWGRAVETHSCVIDRPIEHVIIENCIMRDTLTNAIRAYNWNHVKIVNNEFYNCGTAIMVNTPFEWRPQDTILANGIITNKSIDNYDYLIEGNSIHTTTFDGDSVIHALSLWGQPSGFIKEFIISNNVVNDSITTGILVFKAEEGTVSGNFIKDCGGNGISVNDASDIAVLGNTIKNATNTGIICYNSDVSNLITDNVNIHGNAIEDAGDHGIYTHSQTDLVRISGNTVKNPSKNGVYGASGVKGLLMTDNNIIASNSTASGVRVTSTVKQSAVKDNLVRGTFATGAVFDERTDGNGTVV